MVENSDLRELVLKGGLPSSILNTSIGDYHLQAGKYIKATNHYLQGRNYGQALVALALHASQGKVNNIQIEGECIESEVFDFLKDLAHTQHDDFSNHVERQIANIARNCYDITELSKCKFTEPIELELNDKLVEIADLLDWRVVCSSSPRAREEAPKAEKEWPEVYLPLLSLLLSRAVLRSLTPKHVTPYLQNQTLLRLTDPTSLVSRLVKLPHAATLPLLYPSFLCPN